MMKFIPAGENLIKGFEGCRLEAYLCPAGIWTIGWGCTRGVTPGMKISQEQADAMFQSELMSLIPRVREAVSPGLSDNQFSAAVCFAYNVKRWQTTPLFAFLHRGEIERAEAHWTLYCKADGKELEGLRRRREAELSLFKAPEAQG